MLSLQQKLQKKRGNLFDVIRFSNVHSWLKSKGGAVSPCMTRWQWNQCAQRGAAGVEWLVIALSPCMARRHPPTPAERRRNDTLECRSPHQRTYSHLNQTLFDTSDRNRIVECKRTRKFLYCPLGRYQIEEYLGKVLFVLPHGNTVKLCSFNVICSFDCNIINYLTKSRHSINAFWLL